MSAKDGDTSLKLLRRRVAELVAARRTTAPAVAAILARYGASRVSEVAPADRAAALMALEREAAVPGLRRAVLALDPDVDSNWSQRGLPLLLVLERATGRAGIFRRDVEAVAPGWTRERAREARKARKAVRT
jgi:hypothetical protein